MNDFKISSKQLYSPQTYLINYNGFNYRFVHCNAVRCKGYEQSLDFDYQDAILDKLLPKIKSHKVYHSNLSRSKRTIRELSLCNDFEYFATCTVSSNICDRYSLDSTQDKLKKILHYYKRKYKDFIFLFITEKHKDGAYHFHGLIGGLPQSAFIVNDYGYLELEYFSKNLGFNSFSKIKSIEKISNYITKYITKDCVKNSKNQIYFCSRGLKRAEKLIISPADYFLPVSYSNDYCSITDFNINQLNLTEKIKLYKFFEKIKDL